MGMIVPDLFSEHYAELLDGVYDCVDRIVLNAYYPLAQSPGGLRTWWRRLEGGDEGLDNAHLMRLAGRFSRRVHGWARKKGIPVIHCEAGERKHEIAEKHLPSAPYAHGVFLVLVSRAPAPVWDIERYGKAGMNIRRKQPFPYVNHYSFHIVDPEWGHITIKMSGHPPFGAQIILNGHEFVARQATRKGIEFSKEGNCFTAVSNAAGLAKTADTLRLSSAVGQLSRVCERWIYRSCLCFALDFAEQKKTGFEYSYSVYQVEYSRNLLFKRGWQMDEVFAGVIDRTRGPLDLRTVKTVFGARHRPHQTRRAKPPRLEVVLERPGFDLTIFKVHFRKQTLKAYTKGERVLRFEGITHNARDLDCGIALDRFPGIVARLAANVQRFLQVLRCIDVAWISDQTLDELPLPTHLGGVRVGGLDVNKTRTRAVMEAVIALAPHDIGFSVSELAAKTQAILQADYGPRQAAYDLRKLRGKGLVARRSHSRRYLPSPQGLRTMAALSILRDKVIKPLLAGAGKLKLGRKPKNRSILDARYEAVQREMQPLFRAIGLAA